MLEYAFHRQHFGHLNLTVLSRIPATHNILKRQRVNSSYFIFSYYLISQSFALERSRRVSVLFCIIVFLFKNV